MTSRWMHSITDTQDTVPHALGLDPMDYPSCHSINEFLGAATILPPHFS